MIAIIAAVITALLVLYLLGAPERIIRWALDADQKEREQGK